MRNIKTIFILVLSLILLFAVSCSNEDKTGGETETTETTEIEAKDFPKGLEGTYQEMRKLLWLDLVELILILKFLMMKQQLK